MPKPILSSGLIGLPKDSDVAARILLTELGALPIPLGAPGLDRLLSMCSTVMPAICAHFRMPSERFVQSMSGIESLTESLVATPRPAHLPSSHPEWRLAVELTDDAPIELQLLFVGEVILATAAKSKLPAKVLKLRDALAHWRQAAQLPTWVSEALADLLDRLVQAYDRGSLVAPEVRRRLVSQRIALQLRQQVSFDDPHRARLVRRGQELTEVEIETALLALRAGIDQGDLRSLLVATSYWLGVLIEDMLDLPFDPRPGDTLQLILPEGLSRVDLSLALNELDAQRLPGTIAAGHELVRHLPLLLAQGLYERRQAAQRERFYGDLLGQAQLRPWDPVPFVPPELGDRITISRLIQSRTVFLVGKGVNALIAGLATLRLDHQSKSTYPYAAARDNELWRAECRRSDVVPFGPLVPRASRMAVGSTTTPRDEQVLGALAYLEQQSEAVRPWRKAAPEQVIVFHNAYARYMALAISFFLAFREFRVFPLLASMLGRSHLTTIRHKASSRKQVPPLTIFPFVQKLLALWVSHCESLDQRIDTLLLRYPRHPQLIAAKAHTAAVVGCRPVPLLFSIAERHIMPMGTAAVRAALPPPWQLSEDAGRHWLFDALREQGLSSVEAQFVIQHIVPGSELLSSDSSRSPVELRTRAAAAHQRAVMQLRISAARGFKP